MFDPLLTFELYCDEFSTLFHPNSALEQNPPCMVVSTFWQDRTLKTWLHYRTRGLKTGIPGCRDVTPGTRPQRVSGGPSTIFIVAQFPLTHYLWISSRNNSIV